MGDRGETQQPEESQEVEVSLSRPEPEEEVYYGLIGEIIRAVEPHSEASPAAIHLQLLVMLGTAIGRRAHFRFGSEMHYLNMYVLLVGQTGLGRKGTSYNQAKYVFDSMDDDNPLHFASGLSTGEGLVAALLGVDPDAAGSHRLFVTETEFAAVCKVKRRDGNKVSEVIRTLWDAGRAQIMTKVKPLILEGAHLSIVGHVTPEELRSAIQATDITNGFLNRFLLVGVHRSKLLPDITPPDEAMVVSLANRLLSVVKFGRSIDEMRMSDRARELWRLAYPLLNTSHGPVIGALTARAAAHVMRLASIYTLADRSSVVDVVHLQAALAFWRYVEASVRYVFGDSLGDAHADKLLVELRNRYPKGMSTTEISIFLNGHVPTREVLKKLLEYELVEKRVMKDTGGRPKTVWYAKQAKNAMERLKASQDSSLSSLNSPVEHDDEQNYGPDDV